MTRIRFEDLPSTNTPRNAENLNKLNNVVISPAEPTTGEEVWIQKGKNLVNNIISGYGLYTVDGSLTASDAWFVTDFIEVKPNTSYTSSGFSTNYKAFYDENHNFISGITEKTATTPSNAKYMRMNGLIAKSSNMEIEEGTSIISKKIHTKNDNGVYEEFYDENDNLEVYSLAEQRIGTWINGKPLYRKVFYSIEQILAQEGYVPNTTIPNISQVVNMNITIGAGGEVTTNSNWSSGNYFISTQYDKSRGLYIKANYAGFYGYTVMLDYTKTTD